MLHHVILLGAFHGPVLWWTNCPRAECLKIWYVLMFCRLSSPRDAGAYSSNGKRFSSTCFMYRLLHQRHFCKEGQSLFSVENLCALSCFIMSCCFGHYAALCYGGQTVHELHASRFWYVPLFHECLGGQRCLQTLCAFSFCVGRYTALKMVDKGSTSDMPQDSGMSRCFTNF